MADKILGNNQVNIYGEVVSEFAFSHEVYGEGFYMVYLSVKRLSQVYDKIPLMVSERLIDITKDYRGMYMEASGQFRSYNRHDGCQPSVWQIRLHSLHLLGKKCPLRRWIWCRRTRSAVGTDSEP